MSRLARLASLVLLACALAALPATAGAAGTRGNRCGKGHTKHSRALGKTCAKKHKGHAKRRDQATPPAPITVPAAVVKKCKDEQAADDAAFQAKYANAAGREALGRCIRINAEGGDSTTDTTPAGNPAGDGTVSNAAQACAAEKVADAAAFQAKYADENGREAFGRCVRQAVQAGAGDQSSSGGQGDQGAAPEQGDGTDQSDAPADGGSSDGSGSGDGGDPAASGVDSLFF